MNDNPFESVSGFFDSALWTVALLLIQVFFILLWAALVYWTYQDAKRRIREPAFIAGAVALSLLIPYLGSIIYLIVRPPEYLFEERERELELMALEQRLAPDDAQGRELVSRLRERDGAEVLNGGALERALRTAGVARQEQVVRLEARIAELEAELGLRASPEERRRRREGGRRRIGSRGEGR